MAAGKGAAGGLLSAPMIGLAALYLLWTYELLWVLWIVGGLAVAVPLLVLAGRMWIRARLYKAEQMPVPRWRDLYRETLSGTKQEQKIRTRWGTFCGKRGWMVGKGDKAAPMTLVKLKPQLGGDAKASVNYGALGLPIDEVMAHAETLASTVECRRVQVVPGRPGWAELRFKYADPLASFLPVRDLPWAPKGRVAYGRREDESAASIFLGMHTIAVGSSGSGKSRWIRAVLTDLLRQGIPTDFYVGDPSGGAELGLLFEDEGAQHGLFRVRKSATDNKGMYAMFSAAARAMEKRMEDMARRRENPHKITAKEPLVIVLVDEILGLDPKQLKEGSDFSMLLSRGRKANYWVIGLAQEGHASVLGTIRNLFPQRVGFALPDRFNVDAAFGDMAHARGALCHRINNDDPKNKGLGYSGMEGSATFDRFRAANVTDDDWARVCRGQLPAGMSAKRPTKQAGKRFWVYEVKSFPNDDGAREYLYVGKTTRAPADRFEEHEQDPAEPWWLPMGTPGNEVDAAAIDVHPCKTKEEMDRLEQRLIEKNLPKYNTVFNLRNHRRVNRRPKTKKPVAPVVQLDERRRGTDWTGEHEQQAWGE